VLGWLWLLMGSATAASLQVAPTSLQLTPRQNADALWLTNSGTTPVQVQVRVFEWRQDTGQDQLLPTTALQVSPPMQSLAAGQQQLKVGHVRACKWQSPACCALRARARGKLLGRRHRERTPTARRRRGHGLRKAAV
jgi:hypothetical protein